MLTTSGPASEEPQGVALGGLLERAGMRAVVTAALQSAPVGGIAVAVVGLDRFSGVNAALGRTAGDRALEQVAARLASTGTALARLGGDEFAVLAIGGGAGAVGEHIAAALRAPLEVDGRSVFLGASIGVACGPVDGCDATTLLQHADTAMQLAKERGGGVVLRYAGSLRSEAEHRLAIASGLQLALEHDELVLHYQPIVQAGSRRIVGVEALVRWRHPELGMIPPDEFIPIAEDTGLIVPLGEWVLDEACRQASRWQRIQPLRVAVNLSARQLEHQRFENVVARTLEVHGLDPHLLELELTERSILHDHDEVAATLGQLRTLGVSCSVDDFGTGYGGLSYLIDFPVGELKIDRTFVREIDAGGSHAAIVSALIRLARDLQLRVVAEGVETESQASFLEREGCDELQGYLLSEPLPAGAISDVLRAAPSPAPSRPTPEPDAVPVTSASTRPTPVRPGPRRTRRRLAPVLVAAAVGCALTASAPAGALPAFGQRTIAAVAAVADVVTAGVQHVGQIVSPDAEPDDQAPPAFTREVPSSRVTVASPPAEQQQHPIGSIAEDESVTPPVSVPVRSGQARRPVSPTTATTQPSVDELDEPGRAPTETPAAEGRGQGREGPPATPATPATPSTPATPATPASPATPDAAGERGNGQPGTQPAAAGGGNGNGNANANANANGSGNGPEESGRPAASEDRAQGQGSPVTGEDPPGQRGAH